MTQRAASLVALELRRAERALSAAELLCDHELFEDAVSRSYYCVLHAARAALLTVGVTAGSHVAVRRLFGLHLVRDGPLERQYATILTAGQEDRELGDYDVGVALDPERCRQRVHEAGMFLHRVRTLLEERPPQD